MICGLYIENYALIEKLNLNFNEGFSVITGETGAGKSIMLGALSLILGSRADVKSLRLKDRKCIVEGYFNIKNYQLNSFFEKYDLDYDENSILRREISVNGKSRAFINDTPVTLLVMKELGSRLLNIHSQQSTVTLNKASFQLALIDSYAQLENKLESYRLLFIEYKSNQERYNQLKDDDARNNAELDFLQFQFDELDIAGLEKNEQNVLEEEVQLLTHSEEIKSTLIKAGNVLSEDEQNINGQLAKLNSLIQKLAGYHTNLREISERFKSTLIELNDISSELVIIGSELSTDPQRMIQLNERLDVLYGLQQKHRVQSVTELIEIKNQIESKLLDFNSLTDKIENLELVLKSQNADLFEKASQISEKRNKVFPAMEKQVIKMLGNLGITDAGFKIINTKRTELSVEGLDKIQFVFNANKGGELQEISKIASGGELSRLMLCLKSMISSKQLLPTIIFDEIDSGVSGEVASKVGVILSEMGKSMQVLAITHLPQIAGKGKNHYCVYKDNTQKQSRSFIVKLNKEERIIEIAKMISGSEITEVAKENAKVLLS